MTRADLEAAVTAALTPEHFYLGRGLALRVEQRETESLPWELFRGHLLDASQTRLRRTFHSWLVFLTSGATEPALAIRHDPGTDQLSVTRSILVYGHEAYDDQGAIQTREVEKWQRELVGTIELRGMSGPALLRKLLEHYLFLAVIGASRLPITSLESPLPGFSLGQLGYFPSGLAATEAGPATDPGALLDALALQRGGSLEQVKLLELALRALPRDSIQGLVAERLQRHPRDEALHAAPELAIGLFNNLALSPYTGLAENLSTVLLELASLERPGVWRVAKAFSYLLRHLIRHLTAFDLHVFHNRGANYPDALALDAWLRAYLLLIERRPDLFEDRPGDENASIGADWKIPQLKRQARRALRQAWLTRKQLEGLRVPDHPTSPGENLRVLPPPFARLPDEEVLQPDQRSQRLFMNEPAEQLLTPAARRVLDQSLRDLEHDPELRELGLAMFLDRPFGVFKQPGEVDRTPLFAYEAFSCTIAMSRLNAWHQFGFLTKEMHATLAERLLHGLEIKGIPVMDLPGRERPGVVALEDAIRASPDFVILRATKSTAELFQRLCLDDPRVNALPIRRDAGRVFPIRSSRARLFAEADAFLTIYDDRIQPVIEFGLGQRERGPVRYQEWAGVENLAEGLRVLRYWDDAGREVLPGSS